MRFTDERFHMSVTEPHRPTGNGCERPTEDQMEVWLKEARKGTRIVFKEAAFQ